MKFPAAGALTTLILVSSALAQAPRAEIFAGYSLERIAPCGTTTTAQQGSSCGLELGELQTSTTNYNGWNASATGYVNRFFGVTADFSGHYGSTRGSLSTSRYSFLFGPTFALHTPRLTPFTHALFGEIKESSSDDKLLAYTKFAVAVGGGVDMSLSRRLAVRLGQFDYVWQRNPTNGLSGPHGFRYSGGIVFKF